MTEIHSIHLCSSWSPFKANTHKKKTVLVLAGAEVIFFLVAGMGFWICAELRVSNTEMILLLLSRPHTVSRPFLLLPRKKAWAAEAGRGHSWES